MEWDLVELGRLTLGPGQELALDFLLELAFESAQELPHLYAQGHISPSLEDPAQELVRESGQAAVSEPLMNPTVKLARYSWQDSEHEWHRSWCNRQLNFRRGWFECP